ncbi:peptide deformylase [Caldimicrobium thiodismutans]|jgi:peptide deformylase|uniref:Peptide deformylase n=1 Tax=Caldimicrobium thiodismutans TaxID=1653476 RepID=A0A0U5APJ4_9BACT|nr:peptide deformylase [Caldimicrobium thiodismutans]BAU23842.1 peptide deformylase [Caldimicrobium thiodismutans]
MKIITLGNPILREKARPVSEINGELKTLIEKMADLMYRVKGLGLAANQVGIPERFFIMDIAQKEGKPLLEVYINPEIISAEGETEYDEGCLSIPGYYAKVDRFSRLFIRAYDLEGKEFERELTGLHAIAFQHEYDHLEGILFIDRLSPLKRELFKKWWKKNAPSSK